MVSKMLKLDFCGIGAPRCGTTSLHDILIQHPNIFLPSVKEVHFFNNPQNYSKGLGWYEQFFKRDNKYKIYGEITPSYIYHPNVPERIHTTFGKDIKLIINLRNPVSRAFSHYKINKRKGFEKATFIEAVKRSEKKLHSNMNAYTFKDYTYHGQN